MKTKEELHKIRYQLIKDNTVTEETEEGIRVFTDYHKPMEEYASLLTSEKDKRIEELEKVLRAIIASERFDIGFDGENIPDVNGDYLSAYEVIALASSALEKGENK